jgi:hypothetical protein
MKKDVEVLGIMVGGANSETNKARVNFFVPSSRQMGKCSSQQSRVWKSCGIGGILTWPHDLDSAAASSDFAGSYNYHDLPGSDGRRKKGGVMVIQTTRKRSLKEKKEKF